MKKKTGARINVLVLCGGRSAERDVSCVSAAAILRNMSSACRPLLVYLDGAGLWHLQKSADEFARHPEPFRKRFDRNPVHLEPGAKSMLVVGRRRLRVDVVFPVLHGPYGEDGTIQGLLDFYGLPYVGAGVLGSAAGMDKEFTKRLAREAGVPVLPYVVVCDPRRLGAARRLKFPVFVKPLRLGSSVGVYRVRRPSALAGAVRKALRYDVAVLVEPGVDAREIECAVLGERGSVQASVPGEIRPNAEFYSYEAKYLDPNGAELLIPARLTARQSERVRALAVRAFEALGGGGLARVDFLLDRRTGRLWFNEANTMPGFTAISMYPKLWEASGLSFTRLIDRLIGLALVRHRRRSRLRLVR
ncbi:MAG: D-alanine--D-alanine ligase family protein [Elusimicrobiota bacterium]